MAQGSAHLSFSYRSSPGATASPLAAAVYGFIPSPVNIETIFYTQRQPRAAAIIAAGKLIR